MQMKKVMATMLAASALVSLSALAQPVPANVATFESTTQQLKLPWVALGANVYQNVLVRVDAMRVNAVGSSTSLFAYLSPSSNPIVWTGSFTVYPAAQSTYSDVTRTIALPHVVLGPTVYEDVSVQLENFALLSAGASFPAACDGANFTTANYNAITRGMSPADISALLGCAPSRMVDSVNPTTGAGAYGYYWLSSNSTGEINASFDTATGQTPLLGDFKGWSGHLL